MREGAGEARTHAKHNGGMLIQADWVGEGCVRGVGESQQMPETHP